jgi:putative transposon-encoded protein
MKNLKYLAIACLLFSMALTSCMNDNFDAPSASDLAYKPYAGTPVNTTIKALKDKYATVINNDSLTMINDGSIIEGTVVSSDAAGNFYQQLVIQDATGGIQISIAQKGLHIYYPLGQKVVIKCDSMYIGGYGNSPLLGSYYYNTTKGKHQVGRMNQSDWEKHATPDSLAKTSNMPAAREITRSSDLTTADVNTLITLKNVSFENPQYQAFGPKDEGDGGYGVNRTVDFANSSTTLIRTSIYANFASEALPGGTGDITGVMGYYNGTYQFYICDYKTGMGSTFTQYDAVKIPLFKETLSTSLGDFTSHPVTGALDWSVSSTFKCTTISGYVSGKRIAAVSYLVSPTIDLTGVSDAFVSFDGTIAYADMNNVDANHQLLVSSDYAGDPATATWTSLPYDKSASSTGSFNFMNSGKVSIPSQYIGKKVTFALCYKSSTTYASTWEVKNFMVDEGKGEVTLYSASLTSGNTGFTAFSTTGAQTWNLSSSYGITMNGYSSGANNANVDWAISPEIDLSTGDNPRITFDHAINYAKSNPFTNLHTLWITTNYTGDPATTTWTQLEIPNYPTGANWTFVSSGKVTIPSAYQGKTVRIAFKYESTTTVATTWEIKNLKIK